MTTGINTRDFVKEMYAIVAKGELDRLDSFLASDVVLVEADNHPYPGTWTGYDQVVSASAEILKAIGMTRLDVNDVIGGDGIACGLIELTCTNTAGDKLDMEVIERFTIRDGKVVHIQPFYHDTAALIAHMQRA